MRGMAAIERISSGWSVGSAAVLIRYLGADEYGQYITVFSLVAVLGTITEAGTTNLGIREYTIRSGDDRERLMRHLLGMRTVLTLVGIVAGVAFALVAGYERAMVLGTLLGGIGLLFTLLQATVAIPLSVSLRLGTVTLEFARAVIEEETGTTLVVPPPPARRAASGNGHTAVESDDVAEVDPDGPADEGPRLIARDDKNIPLVSSREWTAEAVERILRVPSGFMRNRTQERIEALAAQRDVTAVDLALVEEGIAIGRKMMEEMIAGYQKSPEASRAAYKAADVTRPDVPTNLNEVGLMSEMARRRGAADKGEGLEN